MKKQNLKTRKRTKEANEVNTQDSQDVTMNVAETLQPEASEPVAPPVTEQQQPIQITEIPLNLIIPNSDNPRKFTDDKELTDITQDISKNGLIHPITVRKMVDSDKYQLVAGERRYRAFRILNRETIPCIIKEFNDDQALEVMMAENLIRQDLKPVEEAKKYQTLMWQKKYTVKEVAAQFGLKEQYVYNRLALLNMIPEIEQMVNNEEISLSVANEISKYSLEVQRSIYEQHLKTDDFRCWKQFSLKVFQKKLTDNYSTLLSNYTFDKTECLTCNFNSEFLSIFPDSEESRCKNCQCLHDKQQKHVIDKTLELAKTYPDAAINIPLTAQKEDAVIKQFEEIGLTITRELPNSLPEFPTKPVRKNFKKNEEYEAALCDFVEENKKCEEKQAAIREAITKGTAKYVIDLSDKSPEVKYIHVKKADEGIGKKERTAKVQTAARIEEIQQKKKEEKPDPSLIIEQLRTKDRQNKVQCDRNINEDLTRQLLNNTIPATPLNKLEQAMAFYVMCGKLRNQTCKQLGFENDAQSDIKKSLKKINKLSGQQKNIITRDFLIDFITQNSYGGRTELLHEFMKINFPKDVEVITQKHTDDFNMKHANIEEKLKVLEGGDTQDAENKCTENQIIVPQEQEENDEPFEVVPFSENEENTGVETIDYINEEQITDAIIIEGDTPFENPHPNLLPVTYQTVNPF